uniref:Protein BTG3 n=2 Tax=Lygus hesperus TaxID=30085 RepID=A0A0A9ZAA1_LYGHE
MREEISAAVVFLGRLLEKSASCNPNKLEDFKERLREALEERFQDHWFPENPDKGQGYRCIRVNGVNRREPTLEKAAVACGIRYEDMNLPCELTIWVDPNEVCCRFGENKGSFCTLASFSDKESSGSASGGEESERSSSSLSSSPQSSSSSSSLSSSSSSSSLSSSGSSPSAKFTPNKGNGWRRERREGAGRRNGAGHLARGMSPPHVGGTSPQHIGGTSPPHNGWFNVVSPPWLSPSPPPYHHLVRSANWPHNSRYQQQKSTVKV